SEIRPARPVADARAAVASIQQVRCAGITQPLKRLYAKASASAGHQARTGAGHRSKAAGTRRAQAPRIRRHAHSAIAASIVMCNPEIDIRWPTPVRWYTCQSLGGMADWS